MNDEILKRALKEFGAQAQIIMAFEECGEFIAALSQDISGRETNVIEEIADVTILMRQMSLLFGVEKVEAIIEQKLSRLETCLQKHAQQSVERTR